MSQPYNKNNFSPITFFFYVAKIFLVSVIVRQSTLPLTYPTSYALYAHTSYTFHTHITYLHTHTVSLTGIINL